MNRNLLRNTYGRLCIKFSQSRMKGERHRLSPLSLQFFTYLPNSQIQKNFLFIQTNSFIIFTCPNPVLLVPGFGQVGWCEDWVHTNKLTSHCVFTRNSLKHSICTYKKRVHTNKLTSHSVFSRNSLKHVICARIYVNELIPMLKVFNIQVTTQKMFVFNWK